MKKSLMPIITLIILTTLYFFMCHNPKTQTIEPSNPHLFNAPVFAGKTIGMTIGTIWEPIIVNVAEAKPYFYKDVIDGYADVRSHIIDGYITDLSAVKVYVSTPEGHDFAYAEVPFDVFNAPMGAVAIDEELLSRFNAFLANLVSEGTLQKMQNYWFRSAENLTLPMPTIPPPEKPKGTLRVATSDGSMPFSFYGEDDEIKGYSVELISRFASAENMAIVFSVMVFGGMIPSVINKNTDIAIADITITEERKKSVFFSEPIFYDQAGIVYLK